MIGEIHRRKNYTFHYGYKYEWEYMDGEKHGKGIFTSPNGHKYYGNMEEWEILWLRQSYSV